MAEFPQNSNAAPSGGGFSDALGKPAEQSTTQQQQQSERTAANNTPQQQQQQGDQDRGFDPMKTMQQATTQMNKINKEHKKYKRQYQQFKKSLTQAQKLFGGCLGNDKK